MSRTPTATTEQGSLLLPASSTCSLPCTRMKPPEAAKHDVIQVSFVGAGRPDRRETHSPASLGALCPGDFHRVRISRTPPTQGAHQVHPLDAFALSVGWSRHRLGHVPLLPLILSRQRNFVPERVGSRVETYGSSNVPLV